jgi:putative MATE family efflux protein
MKLTVDLDNDSPGKIFFYYAVPAVLVILAHSSAAVIDGIFIGRYIGTTELAAVNLFKPLFNVIWALGIMAATGSSTIAATSLGDRNFRKADSVFSLTLLFISITALLFASLSFIFRELIADLMGADSTVRAPLLDYMSVILLFSPAYIIVFLFDAFIRCAGKPAYSIVSALSGTAVNLSFNYLFIVVLSMGIRGAALATAIAQLTTFSLLIYFLHTKTDFKITLSRIDFREIGRIFYNGLSEFSNELSAGFTAFLFNLMIITRIGTEGVAAFGVLGYANIISSMFFFGVSQAIQPLVSYNFGAKRKKNIYHFLKHALICNFFIGTMIFLLLFFKGNTIASIFLKDDMEVIKLTVSIAKLYSFTFIISGINKVLSMFFTAIHRPGSALITVFSRRLVSFLIALAILPPLLGNNGLWLSFLFAETVTLLICIFLLKINKIKEF